MRFKCFDNSIYSCFIVIWLSQINILFGIMHKNCRNFTHIRFLYTFYQNHYSPLPNLHTITPIFAHNFSAFNTQFIFWKNPLFAHNYSHIYTQLFPYLHAITPIFAHANPPQTQCLSHFLFP